MPKLKIWMFVGSTYVFLTAMRLRTKLKNLNIQVEFCPINVLHIFKATESAPPFPPGENHKKISKVNYMWKDIGRRAEIYGLPRPLETVPYPLENFSLANKIAVLANTEGWYLDYMEETYKRWFINGWLAGSDENIRGTLRALGKSFESVIHAANETRIRDIYISNTGHALKLGIFGVPSFSIGEEIFWGDDRLEDAIAFISK